VLVREITNKEDVDRIVIDELDMGTEYYTMLTYCNYVFCSEEFSTVNFAT
jgi:hypothetical protein